MNLVVAVDKEWGIGYKGDLLARVRADLKHFAEITAGKTVVYGSNTLATFPSGKVLKNRINIVLNPDPNYQPEGAIVVHSLDELFEELRKYNTDDVFVIGGASVYNQLLPYCKRAYVTKFDKNFSKDTYIPDLDASPDWELISEGDSLKTDPLTDTGGDFTFRFTMYENKLREKEK